MQRETCAWTPAMEPAMEDPEFLAAWREAFERPAAPKWRRLWWLLTGLRARRAK